MFFGFEKKDLIKLLKYTSCERGFVEDYLEVSENRADHLTNE